MSAPELSLTLLSGTYAICRLPAGTTVPAWAAGDFVSLTRTAEELSIICRQDAVPEGVRREAGWRCLRVAGTLDFALVGVLAALVAPLAEAGVSVFAVSNVRHGLPADPRVGPGPGDDRAGGGRASLRVIAKWQAPWERTEAVRLKRLYPSLRFGILPGICPRLAGKGENVP
jgi:hypothetical protein